MTQPYQDRFTLNLVLTVLFVIGTGASLYFIYSLPVELRLEDGYQSEFLSVYLTAGATFLLGLVSLIYALRYKKEIIVFRDKIIDKAEMQRDAAEQAGKTTISLDAIRETLQQATQKEALSAALQSICKEVEAGQGALYMVTQKEGKRFLELSNGYALAIGETATISFEMGEGLVGQVGLSGKTILIDEIPEGYINIVSGLGSSSPRYLVLVPVQQHEQIVGVLEVASFKKVTEDERRFVEESAQLIAEKILKKA